MNDCRMQFSFLPRAILSVAVLLGTASTYAESNILRLATTTSTENSGLMAKLLPVFEGKNDVLVHTIVSGTGRALNHARNGDVDVILVHAKNSELKLIEEGYGINRQEIMYNDFVIVGPQKDPAGIKGLTSLNEGFSKIASSGAMFVSRGDDSGTHKKELELWEMAGAQPSSDSYRDVGLGMGKTLQIADELEAYTLTDKGTWLALRDRLSLLVFVESSNDGINVYGVIAVNPERHPQVNSVASEQLIAWLQSDEAKAIISNYRVGGEQLFYVFD